MGRIVLTHSTYLDGLIPLLRKLVNYKGIRTITPGEIRKVKRKAEKLTVKTTIPILGGYKLIARNGTTAQEVFIITEHNKQSLESIIRKVISD